MATYAMLLWDKPEAFKGKSPAEMQAIISEYVTWRQHMAATGTMKAGHKLRDEGGKHLKGGVVADGPYAEAHEVIGGFFLIEAADYAEAVETARSCPHLKFGWIELRETEKVG